MENPNNAEARVTELREAIQGLRNAIQENLKKNGAILKLNPPSVEQVDLMYLSMGALYRLLYAAGEKLKVIRACKREKNQEMLQSEGALLFDFLQQVRALKLTVFYIAIPRASRKSPMDSEEFLRLAFDAFQEWFENSPRTAAFEQAYKETLDVRLPFPEETKFLEQISKPEQESPSTEG